LGDIPGFGFGLIEVGEAAAHTNSVAIKADKIAIASVASGCVDGHLRGANFHDQGRLGVSAAGFHGAEKIRHVHRDGVNV